jgi:hypothetical protein
LLSRGWENSRKSCPGPSLATQIGTGKRANVYRFPFTGCIVAYSDTALRTLNITRTSFEEINGNIQGFANGREIALNPLAALPHKTTFHEMAHIVLGHTGSEKLVDNEQTARHIREVEAESVALICCETLGLEGADFCRGYIQHWLKTEKEIPNHSAARIFAAATSILKAGAPETGGQ